MKATVVGIESASQFTDGEERITLKFEDADSLFNRIRLRASLVPTLALELDAEVEVALRTTSTHSEVS